MSISKSLYHLITCLWSPIIAACIMQILGLKAHRKKSVYLLGNFFTFSLLYFFPLVAGIMNPPLPYLYVSIIRVMCLFPWIIFFLNGLHSEQFCYILFYIAFFKTFANVMAPLYAAFSDIPLSIYIILDYSSYLAELGFIYLFTRFLHHHMLHITKPLQNRKWLMVLYCPLSFIIIMELVNPQIHTSETIRNAAIALLTALNIPIIYYLFSETILSYEKSLQFSHALEESKAQVTRYRYSVALEDRLKKERHELKNRYFYLQMLAKEKRYEEVEQYLEKQTQQTFGNSYRLTTGNTLLDHLLNTKMKEAEKAGIHTVFDTLLPQNLDMNEDILCTILLNLLDNAIESSQKEDNPEIHVSLKCLSPYLVIKISNKISHSILSDNPKLKTTKKDTKSHGHGIKIIQELVNEQEGICNISEKDHYFIFTVMLPFM